MGGAFASMRGLNIRVSVKTIVLAAADGAARYQGYKEARRRLALTSLYITRVRSVCRSEVDLKHSMTYVIWSVATNRSARLKLIWEKLDARK